MKLATIILILLAFSSGGVSISAQTNLVPNSGFEECSGYPTEPGESALITGWFSPNPGAPQLPNPSPDFLHVDGKHQAKLPGTAFGSVYPYKGKAVAGFIAFNGYVSDFREYLSIKLKEPMQKGKKYRVSFYLTSGRPFNRSDYNVNLGTGEYIIQRKEGSTKQTIQKYRTYAYPYHTIEANQTSQHYGRHGVNGIGVCLTDNAVVQDGHEPISITPYYQIDTPLFSHKWKKITFIVIPSSSHQYLTIGNFLDDDHIKTNSARHGGNFSYYFIDEVEIIPMFKDQTAEVIAYDTLIPRELKNRKVVIQREETVSDQIVNLKVYDPMTNDGDIVSIYFNGKWLVEEQTLTKKPFQIKLHIEPYQANYLIVHAHNMGKVAPNTAAIKFKVNGEKKSLSIDSNMNKSGGVAFYYRPH